MLKNMRVGATRIEGGDVEDITAQFLEGGEDVDPVETIEELLDAAQWESEVQDEGVVLVVVHAETLDVIATFVDGEERSAEGAKWEGGAFWGAED